MHLAALRALGEDLAVNLKLVVEGSEEQGTGGLEDFVPDHADLLRADMILVCDTGNAAVGIPAATVSLRGMVNVVVTVEALAGELHSGMFGGAAPDALAALVAMLATLRDSEGNTTITRARQHARRGRVRSTRPTSFATMPASSTGRPWWVTDPVSDMLWARPARHHPRHRLCARSSGRPRRSRLAQPRGSTSASRRGWHPEEARDALVEQLRAAAPWGVKVAVDTEAMGAPFRAATEGPGYQAINDAMREAFGRPMASLGQGGSIPLCNVFADTYPDAEMILMGVEEPQCLIHAPNESVDPNEIEKMALAEALFLRDYGSRRVPAGR